MKVLVVGGTNFIGPYAVRRLAEAGHEVAVFHRGRTGGSCRRVSCASLATGGGSGTTRTRSDALLLKWSWT
jgi:nucleoside-diphosphate-sugar epimerase